LLPARHVNCEVVFNLLGLSGRTGPLCVCRVGQNWQKVSFKLIMFSFRYTSGVRKHKKTMGQKIKLQTLVHFTSQTLMDFRDSFHFSLLDPAANNLQ